jgi:hypothetical protein
MFALIRNDDENLTDGTVSVTTTTELRLNSDASARGCLP